MVELKKKKEEKGLKKLKETSIYLRKFKCEAKWLWNDFKQWV